LAKTFKKTFVFSSPCADRNRPIVLDAIKEAKIPCRMDLDGWPCHQKFNNDAIFPRCLPVDGEDEDDDEDDRDWKRGTRNFQLFFGQLADMPTKSLQMTKQVTEYRKQLEMKLQWIMSAIPSHLTRMEELQEKEKFIELHRTEVDANRNFEIKVPVSRKVQVGVDSAMNCTKCETTCHHPCNRVLPMGWCPAFAPPPEAGFWANFADKFKNTFRARPVAKSVPASAAAGTIETSNIAGSTSKWKRLLHWKIFARNTKRPGKRRWTPRPCCRL
jgi:hypothetical protein